MSDEFEAFSAPELGDPLPGATPSAAARRLLHLRRSTSADKIGEPGPDNATLQALLAIAARAPDHRRVTPFRFITFAGAARTRAGDAMAQAFSTANPQAESRMVEVERRRFLRAPVVVAVISCVNRDHRTPEWEQILTAGAVCQNLLIASNAYGYAAQWLTEWYAYDRNLLTELGVGGAENIAGFIYIGAAKEPPLERARPDLAAITTAY